MSTDSSVHDIFEEEAADRDLPSPYMEKHFAKFEGLYGVLLFEVRSFRKLDQNSQV